MGHQRTTILWVSAALAVAAIILVLREILLPFLVGIGLAYLLDPLVTRLQRFGIGRSAAALGIVGAFYVFIVALILLLSPVLIEEAAYLVHQFPAYVARLQAIAADPARPWLSKIVTEAAGEVQKSKAELTSLGANLSANFLQTLWLDGRALISIFSLLVVAPIVALYVLIDWDSIIGALDKIVPAPQRDTARKLAGEIHQTIDVVLRGEAFICLILAFYYAFALNLTGVNHAYLIGLVSGAASFVPYLGLLTGVVLAVGVALFQFWPAWDMLPIILAIFVFGQLISDYVLAPRLVGARARLNPLTTMFAIAAFGYLLGVVGLILAVPLAAAIGVLVRFVAAQEGEQLARSIPHAEAQKHNWWLPGQK